MDCAGTKLSRRDSAGVWGTETLTIHTGTAPTDVLFVETIL